MVGDESQFRSWLTQGGRKYGWIMQPIETNTSSGVPDVFFCVDGISGWMELKATKLKRHYMRVSQYNWFRKYVKVKGVGILAIKRVEYPQTVDVYNVADLMKIPLDTCKLVGNDIVFPADTQPAFTYRLKQGMPFLLGSIQQVCKDYVSGERRCRCKKS